jgi:hypothetical protein
MTWQSNVKRGRVWDGNLSFVFFLFGFLIRVQGSPQCHVNVMIPGLCECNVVVYRFGTKQSRSQVALLD